MVNKPIIAVYFVLLILGCSSPGPKVKSQALSKTNDAAVKPRTNNFEIIDEIKTEIGSKVLLREYAVYKDSAYTLAALESVLREIYNLNRDKHAFENLDLTTLKSVYVFASKDAYEQHKSNWVAMLSKNPKLREPDIIINDFDIADRCYISEEIKRRYKTALKKLMAHLDMRALGFCSLSRLLGNIQLENIFMARALYPDYGNVHFATVRKLNEKAYRGLREKYEISQDMLDLVTFISMSSCD
ncbi:hypothetical protein [Taibaiella koreensis]|uniref:hypothetical protein n=1 Tax=Taibaiella koreensis TaxID=1268548 RepID=UPI000E59A59B|nr:hypothetical protein [Taibaiella koreensis]